MNSEERNKLTEKYFELQSKLAPLKEIENEMKGIKTLLQEDFIDNNIEKSFMDGVGLCTMVTRNSERLDKKKAKLKMTESDFEECLIKSQSKFIKFTAIDELTDKKLEEMRDLE